MDGHLRSTDAQTSGHLFKTHENAVTNVDGCTRNGHLKQRLENDDGCTNEGYLSKVFHISVTRVTDTQTRGRLIDARTEIN